MTLKSICFKRALGAVVLAFTPSFALAWGQLGHRTTGIIAESFLTPQARQASQALLKGMSMAEAAAWADSIRGDATMKHVSYYHFDGVGDQQKYLESFRGLPPEEIKKGGVIAAILVAMKTLESKQESFQDKETALKFMIHFIGDLHQPMHTGRREDRGGNDIKVNWFGQKSNLHAIWDTGMVLSGHADLFKDLPPDADYSVPYARYLMEKNRGRFPMRQTQGNTESWMAESMRARFAAYDPKFETDQEAYQTANLPVFDQRVYNAGLRIAEEMNRIFANIPMSQIDQNLYRNLEGVVGNLMNLITLGPRQGAALNNPASFRERAVRPPYHL